MENNILKNHSNESEVVNSTKVVNGIKNTRKKREESSYLKVRSKAVNIFRNQIDKSVETKRSSVERALEKVISGDYTKNRFLAEFRSNVDLLLDSKRFEKDCGEHNLIPFNAATHIVLDGGSKIELVLKNGIFSIYSTCLPELSKAIFSEEELKKASTVNVPEVNSNE